MQAELISDQRTLNPATGKELPMPAGTIITHPDAFRLVQMGIAKPHDNECLVACGERTAEETARTEHAARRLAACIAPEDFSRFDAGEIVGYNADGSDIPGPNWTSHQIQTEDDE